MTRALAAVGLVGAELTDTLVLTGWTPWGPLPQPNAYFTYDGEAERTKEWAIHCHASQVLLTDYTEYLLAPRPGLRRPDPRVGRGPQPRRPGPPHRRAVRRRRAVPDRVATTPPAAEADPPTRSSSPSACSSGQIAVDPPRPPRPRSRPPQPPPTKAPAVAAV